jgi:hypothetical protein
LLPGDAGAPMLHCNTTHAPCNAKILEHIAFLSRYLWALILPAIAQNPGTPGSTPGQL